MLTDLMVTTTLPPLGALRRPNGFTIELGMSQGKGKGKDDGSEVGTNNTHVSGGKAVNVTSGGT
ncbi:hemagglutinin repeat-containing protein [Variovorax sp. N23]|nr:hemagglutinin repeat-containing protein [Variovorax sp. N23]MCU4121199.1 hemagglutinin repeat-containing protein [Variovorax sp. N23]